MRIRDVRPDSAAAWRVQESAWMDSVKVRRWGLVVQVMKRQAPGMMEL